MNIENIFNNTYVISLPHRLDRRQSVNNELNKLNIPFVFFDAINGHELDYNGPLKKGEEGVRQSHIRLLRECIANKLESVFIFEDDVELDVKTDSVLRESLSYVPHNADLLYLGASHHSKPINVAENIYKIHHSYCVHSVWISSRIFEVLLETIEKNPNTPVDVCYAFLQPHVNAFAFYPHLAWQKNMYSDIQNEFINYDFLKREFVRFEKI